VEVGLFVLLMLAVITVTAVILIPVAWPVGFFIWVGVFFSGSLYLLVFWHAKNTAYCCPECGFEFEISVWTDFTSPQFPNRKLLKCPKCGKRNWVKVLMKKK